MVLKLLEFRDTPIIKIYTQRLEQVIDYGAYFPAILI
jgi:hypothetical protein